MATLGPVYANEGGKEAAAEIETMLASKWSLETALAFLAWYVFAPRCASTLALIWRETGSWRWMALTFVYMPVLAYTSAFVTLSVAHRIGAS